MSERPPHTVKMPSDQWVKLVDTASRVERIEWSVIHDRQSWDEIVKQDAGK